MWPSLFNIVKLFSFFKQETFAMDVQQIVEFFLKVLQAAVAASVVITAPALQQMTSLSPVDTMVFAAGENIDHAELYFMDNGEVRDLGVETWGGHYAPNADCSLIVFSAYNQNYGAHMGMIDPISTMYFVFPSIGPDNAEAFMFPAFGPDGVSFAAVVATPSQHLLLIRRSDFEEQIVFERAASVYLSDIRWIDDDHIAVQVGGEIDPATAEYVSVDTSDPEFKETSLSEDEFEALSTSILLPQALEPTDNTVNAYLCPPKTE